jgi:dienelactone hydrolase
MADPQSVFFENATFDGQLTRSITASYAGSADLGEIFATARRIGASSPDPDSWYREWKATADAASEQAEVSRKGGHTRSACDAFLRASEYYRQAFFFLRGNLDDPRLIDGHRQHVATFLFATALMPHLAEPVRVPYDGTTLSGYLFAPDRQPVRRPTLMFPCGYDSTAEAGWPGVPAALARGYNVLSIEGPGQGSALYTQRLTLRHDYEHVASQVVDWLVARPEVDATRIAIIGRSFAGYLAPRAATREPRFAALVCDPPQPDMGERLPSGFIARVAAPAISAMIKLSDARAEFFHARMAAHGSRTPAEWFAELRRFTMLADAGRIACPTLLIEADNDFAAGGASMLFEALTCSKKLVRLTAAQGADGHCGGLGQQVWTQVAYDWLDDTLANAAQ